MAAVLLCLLTLACGMRTSCGASAVKSTSSPNVTRSWFWTSSPHTPSDLTGSMASMMSGGVFTLRAASYAGLSGVTICLRVIADTTPRPTFFTLSAGPQAIARLEAGEGGRYLLTVGEASRSMAMAALMPAFGKLWPWTGVCVTWDSASGMAQMWLDGRLSVRQAMWRGQSFYGKAALTLSAMQGQVTDVHVWSSALPVSDLRSYNQGWGFRSGDVLSWSHAQYSSNDYVVLEPAYSSQSEQGGVGKRCSGSRRRCGRRSHSSQ